MNRWSTTIVGVCLIALLFAISSAYGLTLPALEGFEGSWSASLTPGADWERSGSGTVAKDSTHVGVGTSGAAISNDTLTANIAGNPANAWFQIWAQPVAGASDPSAAGVSGAFYVKNDGGVGKLMVCDATGWLADPLVTGLPVNGSWIGFVVHVDYAEHKWDLYYATTYANTFTKANSSALTLPVGVAGLTSIAVQSGGKAYVDEWAVSRGLSPAPSSFSKVFAYTLEGTWSDASFQLPIYSDAYTASGADKLGGALGQDLLTMFYTPGDKIKVRKGAANNEWGAYTVNPAGTAWMNDTSSNPEDIGAKRFTIVDKIWLTHTAPNAVGFFPYSALIATEGELADGHPSVTLPPITLNGIAGGSASGYTALNWPANVTDVNSLPINNSPSPGALLIAGDLLYVAVPSSPGVYDTYIWSGTAWNGSGSTSVDVPASADLWLRKQGGNSTITPSF